MTPSFTYNLAGSLKSITDPFGYMVAYSPDKTGRVTSIGDDDESAKYADGIGYRAFGGVKSMALSALRPIDIAVTYDNAQRPATYQASSSINGVHDAEYSYNSDGAMGSLGNNADGNFDQVNKYDFAGRLKSNVVGQSGGAYPFTQSMSYDAFNNITARNTQTYTFDTVTFSGSYTDNRKTSGGSTDTYDNAGNILDSSSSSPSDYKVWKFDAADRTWRWEEFGPYGMTTKKGEQITFDGDGRTVKRVDLTAYKVSGVWGSWEEQAHYCMYSSVTGQKITELTSSGGYEKTNVYMGASAIAATNGSYIDFKPTDPVTGSEKTTDLDGVLKTGDDDRTEIAEFGIAVPPTEPPAMPEPNYDQGGSVYDAENACEFMGQPMPCNRAEQLGEDYVKDKINEDKKRKKKKDDLLGPPKLRGASTAEERAAAAENPVGADEGDTDEGDIDGGLVTAYDTDLDPRIPGDTIQRVIDNFKKPDCNDIVGKMLDVLEKKKGPAASRDAKTLLDRIAEINVKPNLNTNGAAYENKHGRIIDILPPSSSDPAAQRNYYVKIVTAELTHHFRNKGMYSDSDIDDAATAVLSAMTPDEKKRFGRTDLAQMKKNKTTDGDLGHTLINSYCQ